MECVFKLNVSVRRWPAGWPMPLQRSANSSRAPRQFHVQLSIRVNKIYELRWIGEHWTHTEDRKKSGEEKRWKQNMQNYYTFSCHRHQVGACARYILQIGQINGIRRTPICCYSSCFRLPIWLGQKCQHYQSVSENCEKYQLITCT